MYVKLVKTKIITAISILSLFVFLPCVTKAGADETMVGSFAQGYAYAQLDEYKHACKEYSQHVRIHPHAAGLYNNLGNASLYLDLLEDARAAYEKAILAGMDLAAPHYSLANLLSKEAPIHPKHWRYKFLEKTAHICFYYSGWRILYLLCPYS